MQTYNNSNSIAESKAEKWRTQAKRVFESLYHSPKTRLQLSHYENIPIQNICRYIGQLRKLGQVCVTKIDKDPLSKMRSEYLSTNERICRPCCGGQLKMFSDAR